MLSTTYIAVILLASLSIISTIIGVALAEPVGAILGLIAVGFLPGLNPFFMAFAAGAMIFISLDELLPMAHRYKRKSLFVLGIILSVIVYIGLAVLILE